jgi:NAD(P)-dependent dehydrogenase (short-subunit alcohol dehydrogenase family)
MADLRDHLAVSVRGSWLLARTAFAPLRAARGVLVLLTSEAGFEGKAMRAPYAGVKAMQRGMARALAREWGPKGVRVNCIAPLAGTPAMERALEKDPGLEARMLDRVALRRLGDAAGDVGAAVRFLLSDDASYITGHTLMVDGGSCPVT